MYPLLHDGDKASTLKGYYNCHSIEREDIVLIDYPGDKNNLIIKNKKGFIDRMTLSEIEKEFLSPFGVNKAKIVR